MTKLTVTVPGGQVHIMGFVGDSAKIREQIDAIKVDLPGSLFVEEEVEE